jgi:uncharacterized protein (TIGR03086 family)
MSQSKITQFNQVADAVTSMITQAAPRALLGSSPCTGWTGRDVVNHMVGGADLFAGPARGETVPFPDWSQMPDWLGPDPAAAYRAAADRAIAAYDAPGVLDGTVTMPWGEMPATIALDMLTADHVAHAWDLSQASGVPVLIDDAAIDAALATSRAVVSPQFREAGFYRPEHPAPDAATPIERLAAFTGRAI